MKKYLLPLLIIIVLILILKKKNSAMSGQSQLQSNLPDWMQTQQKYQICAQSTGYTTAWSPMLGQSDPNSAQVKAAYFQCLGVSLPSFDPNVVIYT